MEALQKPGGKITRLELMLAAWEDLMYLAEMKAKYTKVIGADREFERDDYGSGNFNNWRSFRKYLLNSVVSGGDFNYGLYGHNWDPFTNTLTAKSGDVDWALKLAVTPMLFAWMRASRRVFNLSYDLQTLIAATTVEDVKISDLKFPFDSFVIELPEPIIGKTVNKYDMLLFARNSLFTNGEIGSACLLISQQVAHYSPLSLSVKRELAEVLKRKKYEAFKRKLSNAENSVSAYRYMHAYFTWLESRKDNFVTEHVEKFYKEFPAQNDVVAAQHAIRILAGLCLYIRTLPPVSKYRTEWQRVDIEPLLMPVQAITDEAEVCMLSTEFTLSPEERIVFGSREVSEELAGSTKKNPHFRQGYWRRPPGQGHNPDAEKSIWVRPAVVNRHLLQKGQLPLGAETILLSPKA